MFGGGGFQFGNTATAAPAVSSGGFQFGNTATAAPAVSSGGFQFGNTATAAPAGGLQFGNTATAAPAGGLQFGNTASAAPAGGLQFGNTATAAPAVGLQFGNTATAAPVGGLQFGSSATNTTTAPSFGLNFGASVSAASSVAATTSTASRGLGGVSLTGTGLPTVSSSSSSGQVPGISDTGSAAKPSAVKSFKDTPLPPEILQTVELMRGHVREQKSACEAAARHSWTPVQRCGADASQLVHVCASVEASLQQLAAGSERLKRELSWTMGGGEVAQRTAATAAGLQYEHTAPGQLFATLVLQFRQAMTAFRRQIDHVQQLVEAGGKEGGGESSPEQVVATMRRLHETLVWLASRIHAVHERCAQLRDQFLQLRRQAAPAENLTDVAALFSGHTSAPTANKQALKNPGVGPSPFSVIRAAPVLAPVTAAGSSIFAPASSLSVNSSFLAAPGSSTGLFGSGSSSSSAFKLEAPPGGKRNKL